MMIVIVKPTTAKCIYDVFELTAREATQEKPVIAVRDRERWIAVAVTLPVVRTRARH
jgi:hypothetical protein